MTWPHYTRTLACVFLQVKSNCVRRLTQDVSSSDLPTLMCMCGGVLYESLVQNLTVDGINLSETVVQRGIGSDVVHLDSDSVCIQTPRREKRIATTFRGICPRGLMELEVTRQIRAKGSKVHIIAMIASTMQGDREECLAAGMDDYVSKSIQVKELQAALERCRETPPQKPY